MPEVTRKNVLVTGANGFIGNAIARAFVAAGHQTYGLVRKFSVIPALTAAEIIPLLSSPELLPSLAVQELVFDIIVSTTEQHPDYISHYHEIITLLRGLATASNAAGTRPLVMFTSGCKDYGAMDFLDGDEGLKPHTEESVLNPPPFAVDRANYAIKTFENKDLFDTVLLRPTNVYGLSGSYYGEFFKLAKEAKQNGGPLVIKENPKTILHALHVEDCGRAYVALASALRPKVAGQTYNISSSRYETLDEIARALAKEFALPGIEYRDVKEVWGENDRPGTNVARMLMGFSQWTSSEKLRKETGWREERSLFNDTMGVYRGAWEVAVGEGYGPLDLVGTLKK